jgi:hypothetical protein
MSDWQSRTEAYKAAILSAIPEVWRLPPSFKVGSDVRHAAEASGILTPEEVKLLAQDATSLAARIASGEISSLEATTAYCKSAAVAHQTTGCIMDFFPEEALARALELDGLRAQGKIVGPLHGVPISIKGEETLRPRPTQRARQVEIEYSLQTCAAL